MLTLKFLPEIEGDILDAVAWYDSRNVEAGDNFLHDFYLVTDDLAHYPKRCRMVYQEFRRALLRTFPYAVYYLIESNFVVVVGVFHCSQDPKVVRSFLIKRANPSHPAAN